MQQQTSAVLGLVVIALAVLPLTTASQCPFRQAGKVTWDTNHFSKVNGSTPIPIAAVGDNIFVAQDTNSESFEVFDASNVKDKHPQFSLHYPETQRVVGGGGYLLATGSGNVTVYGTVPSLKLLWTAAVGDGAGTPYIDAEFTLVSSNFPTYTAFDTKTGKKVGTFQGTPYGGHYKDIFVGNDPSDSGQYLVKGMNVSSGKVLWEKNGTQFWIGPVVSPTRDTFYASIDHINPKENLTSMSKLDITTGEVLWTTNFSIPDPSFDCQYAHLHSNGGGETETLIVWCQPWVAAMGFYYVALDGSSGAQLWAYQGFDDIGELPTWGAKYFYTITAEFVKQFDYANGTCVKNYLFNGYWPQSRLQAIAPDNSKDEVLFFGPLIDFGSVPTKFDRLRF